MTETAAFAGTLLALAILPASAHVLARRSKAAGAGAALLAAVGLAAYISIGFRPDLVAPLVEGTDLALLHPSWGGVPAVALLAALVAWAPATTRRPLTLLALAVAAYFVWDATWLVQDPARAIPGSGSYAQGDVCIQSTSWSCAPAAAVSLLATYGIATDEAEMARLMRTRRNRGTNDLNAQRALARMLAPIGREARLRSLTYDELVAARTRALVPIQHSLFLDHMVALVGADEVGVTLLDPAHGRRVLTRAELEAVWKSRAILVEPAE